MIAFGPKRTEAMPENAHQSHKRLLIISNVTVTGAELFDEIHKHAREADTEVLIVAPALISRLHWWMSDGDAGDVAAQERLTVSLERLRAAGIPARGAFGDADPLQAIDDAMRVFHPDEIIIATHPPGRSNWLERDVVVHARKRFDVPITHVEVDSTTNTAHVIPSESGS
jgi:nucleotide-binding universal stress UspA family protein